MKGVNRVIILGHLGKDVDIRYTADSKAVANFSVATSEEWKDKQTGEKTSKTEWHNIVIFGRLAEIAGEYLRKGSQVYLEGSLRTRKWQDKEGKDHYTTEIIASEMQMIGGKREGEERQEKQEKPQGSNDDGFDDSDIPF